MKMGTAQKQNIAIQHRQWNKSGKPTRAYNPVSFEKWFLLGIRRQEKKDAEFTFPLPWIDPDPMAGKGCNAENAAGF